MLLERNGYTNKEISRELYSKSIPKKVYTYFKKVTGQEFDVNLAKNINKLNSVRNELVHYKSASFLLDEEYESFNRQIEGCKPIVNSITKGLKEHLESIEKLKLENSVWLMKLLV
ncbi:hypothetical protein [Levilactobacillus enshiensis]|uniref:hypothetical protein n=1 Tax=Levilactobacillus enshiensis TaxID=2590213 RepID=UPI001179A078|nr:hypothetical protein [Levilactobacillus enshiensis]